MILSYANVVATLALFAAVGGGAYAGIIKDPIGSDGDIDACFHKRSGDLDIRKGKRCGKGEKQVAWNQSGPLGPQGPQGLQGEQGEPGERGPDGSIQGAPAGGDLTGTYPDPSVVDTIARDTEIVSTVLANDGPGSGLNADQVDGTNLSDLVSRSAVSTQGLQPMRFGSMFMSTSSTANYDIGQVRLTTNSTAGQFSICKETIGAAPRDWVLYLNGVRTTGTISAVELCDGPFDAGAAGDFQVYARRAVIFGVHSGDGAANENYQLLAFSSL